MSIRFEDFTFRHAGRKNPTLEGVNLRIEQGEKVLVLGESGAGKSTLLAALAGLLGDDSEGEQQGRVLIDAPTPSDPHSIRGVVGMVLQDPDSQVMCTRVGDDVVFGCENLQVPREQMWTRARRALDMVGLDLPFEHPTAQLSVGQKQRLALAGVIAMGAKIIVLDEPTANLDPAGVQEVRDAVAQVVAETSVTLIVVEHRVSTWLEVVDRVVVLGAAERGVIADGPAERVLAQQGPQLAQRGVWVPGVPVELGESTPRSVHMAQAALTAENLLVGWESPVGGAHNVSFPLGQSTVITGINGAGKTTLGLTMAGLLKPLDGNVSAHPDLARGASTHPQQWSSAELASRIGFVFQDPEHQFLSRTVREEMLIGPRMMRATGRLFRRPGQPSSKDYERVDELLARLRLDHLADAHPFSLSGGQKRRLSVATALVAAPQIILMDEPTFGQDRRTFIELVLLLRELLAAGTTLAAITHDELFIRLMGDHRIEVGK